MMVRQLADDGFLGAAAAVADATFAPHHAEYPPQRLQQLVKAGLNAEGGLNGIQHLHHQEQDVEMGEASTQSSVSDTPHFEAKFMTTHKQACRAARFSPDGMLIATASADTSIKLLDMSKVVQFTSVSKGDPTEDQPLIKPVIRTFYDHALPINDIAFHPFRPLLASASQDKTIKIFDYSKPLSMKRAVEQFQDIHNVHRICFHPSGNYILAGTDHHAVHLYDINNHTSFCYTSPEDSDNHGGPITGVEYNADGSIFVTSSEDGSLKVWDGITNRCTLTIPGAHSGQEVFSVQLHPQGDHLLLSCGRDNVGRIWDITSGQVVRTFTGASSSKLNNCNNCFSHKAEFVLAMDDVTHSIVTWEMGTGKLLSKTKTDHKSVVRCLATSPVDNCLVTCSEDQRARVWTF